MFCYQCQETMHGTGCTTKGVCGKTGEVAVLQDMLVWVTKGLAEILQQQRSAGHVVQKEDNHRVTTNLFVTITNVNFDKQAILEYISATIRRNEELLKTLPPTTISKAAAWNNTNSATIEEQAAQVGIALTSQDDVGNLLELAIYGLKGLAAYLHHANVLGYDDEEIDTFVQQTLAATLSNEHTLEAALDMVLQTGSYGVKAMALLDTANTTSYGTPEISTVELGVRSNPAILVSGHDLKDLEMLLKQTEGSGVDVYTHSEMLPAHYYPAFKKYSHFAGNYGNAWWQQKEEFEAFGGPILMTTNCIVPPKESYKDRLYTTGAAGYEGCPYIAATDSGYKDFAGIIAHAKQTNAPKELEQGTLVGGFAHQQVLALADQIVQAVQSGNIRKFVVMAGCDGRQKSREYYTDFAKALPKDTVILTAGCAKYRYNKLQLGDINGIPRVLDAGQCNDSYSLAIIALKLKEVFGFDDVNELPIIYNIAWYEQKAVIVLLALLSLGVRNIHLGPTLPAFLTPKTIDILVREFGIAGIGTVEDDMELFFGL